MRTTTATTTIAALAVLAALPACHRSPDARSQAEAPRAAPIALDPHPPMSAADIDAIAADVKRQGEAERAARRPRPATASAASAAAARPTTPAADAQGSPK